MAEITRFEVVAFDYDGDGLAAGEPETCSSPDAAIQRAQGLWKFSAMPAPSPSAAQRFRDRQIRRPANPSAIWPGARPTIDGQFRRASEGPSKMEGVSGD